MFKAYLKLLLKRREFIFAFTFMTIISLGAFLYDCFIQYGVDVGIALSADKLFIGRGNSDTNTLYLVLQFIIPLVIVLPFSDIAVFESNANITPVLLTRADRKSYFRCQLLISGLSSWIVVFIPFILNFILCLIAFPLESINTSTAVVSGIYDDYYGEALDIVLFPELFSINPYLYNFIILLLLCAFCSLCSMLIYTISYFFKTNRLFLLFFAFIINNFLIIITNATNFSISPFDYLFSYTNTFYVKSELFLLLLFVIMILSILVLAPKCVKRLCELK